MRIRWADAPIRTDSSGQCSRPAACRSWGAMLVWTFPKVSTHQASPLTLPGLNSGRGRSRGVTSSGPIGGPRSESVASPAASAAAAGAKTSRPQKVSPAEGRR